MDLREVGYDDRDWINLAQDRDRWRAYCAALRDRFAAVAAYLLISQPSRSVRALHFHVGLLLSRNNERRRDNPGSSAGTPDVTKMADAETRQDLHRVYENRNGQTDGQMRKRKDSGTDRRTNGQTEGRINRGTDGRQAGVYANRQIDSHKVTEMWDVLEDDGKTNSESLTGRWPTMKMKKKKSKNNTMSLSKIFF
ncbi:hypothetical protein ANN_06897 [Periplaneta americana]|uniref:Uncharacterized protein n=1 Tax=Periplaneta americana TaxID=6978 RepID=A0ABQ8TGP3_PERAM|nr:hypothetical protein ANN_06897 [Periplaneta americana]